MKIKLKRAYALFSGGLDSLLSVLWMKKLGYEIIPLFFESYFFSADKAEKIASSAGLGLRVIDIGEKLLEIIKNPRYGFGKNLNPCIDCHSLMFREAGKLMEQEGVDFLISGEVLGQRPMSQRMDAMNAVKKYSGYGDLIIRPLSQKLLPDTKPIREGWINKADMLDIQGRGRHRQIEMAEEFGLHEYSTPGGGCLLTDKGYSNRLKDLMNYNMLEKRFIQFLRFGRHFRINSEVKLIIGRNREELEEIFGFVEDELVLRAANCLGPIGLVNSKRMLSDDEIKLAAEIVLSYTNKAADRDIVAFGTDNNYHSQIEVEKLPKSRVRELIIKADK
ncbi:MAG: hypothetical protein K0B81_00975 [Candidatus Cloacimonetes bacterium]|nr:hypothetical protein [Candidatus Cloacimonadota bacterium]